MILPLRGGAVAANADTMQGMTELTTARPDPRGQRESLRAARTGAALAERPDLVAVQLDGDDVLRYLHSVTSQHLEDRQPGEAAEALLLSPKGRIEFALRLAVLHEGVLADTDAGAADALAERLRRFVFRYDVRVGPAVPGGLSIVGPAAVTTAAAAGLPVPEQPGRAGIRSGLVVQRTPLGVDLLGSQVARVRAELAGEFPWLGPELLAALRIEAGLPRWGLELTDDVLAEEAGLLDSHVHLDKGCYPGQETVARVHNLGQVQRRLAGIACADGEPPPPRTDLLTAEGRRAGQVRGGAVHPELGAIALAYVRRTVASGQELLAAGRPVTVTGLPFGRPAG